MTEHKLTHEELSDALDELWGTVVTNPLDFSPRTRETARHNHWHKAGLCPGDETGPKGDFKCRRSFLDRLFRFR